jgi:hypothetical protein
MTAVYVATAASAAFAALSLANAKFWAKSGTDTATATRKAAWNLAA